MLSVIYCQIGSATSSSLHPMFKSSRKQWLHRIFKYLLQFHFIMSIFLFSRYLLIFDKSGTKPQSWGTPLGRTLWIRENSLLTIALQSVLYIFAQYELAFKSMYTHSRVRMRSSRYIYGQ